MFAATAAVPESAPAIIDDPIEHGRFTRWVVGEHGERLGESSLQIGGMHCAACAGIVEQALHGVEGVRAARVSAAAQLASVSWDPSLTRPSALIDAVRAAGYDAVPDLAAGARTLRLKEHRRALWRLFVASLCAVQVMMLSTPSYLAGPGELAPDLRQLLNWGCWLLSLPVLVFAAGPFFSGAWRALRRGRISMDLPVALGVAITFVASTAATFDPGGRFGSAVYFDSMTMFVSFLLAARYLELRARNRAAEALERSMACLPETAWRLAPDGSATAVSVQRLQPGDLVRVPVGQAFPADGEIEHGATRADEAVLSGESVPVDKPEGAEVVAGSTNLGAPVLMRVRRVGGDTRLEAIVSMMRSAMSQRPAAARLADRWAGPFLWSVLLLAAAAAAVWSIADPQRALWVAVSVLIVTCPCALSLAAPAALVAAARGLAQRGVLLQRLDAIEGLAAVDQIFFDKTGTLTQSEPDCSVRLSAAGAGAFASPDEALAVAAGLAVWSAHPLALALTAAAPALRPRPEWSGVAEVSGSGLRATDAQGREWRLGAASWVGSRNADAGADGVADMGAEAAALHLGCDGKLLASFGFDESPRPGVEAALQALRAQGLRLTLLTGDSPLRAEALAMRLGMTEWIAGATPEAKLAAVTAAQAAGRRVAMVGDGINDAPVLARADVSLAMGQGALVSRSQADAVITSNRVADLVHARRVAARTVRIVRQNLVWAAAYNAVAIPLALAGWLSPGAAGLGMACSSLIVVVNALRSGR
jgi:P-type Cu2+ transporter